MNKEELEFILADVEGWLLIEEAYALYELACAIPVNAVIVEIGSYRGRSTIALALGAKQKGAVVYAIDPHHIHEAGGYQFGPQDNVVFMQNILAAGVAKQVRIINSCSWQVVETWDIIADFVFIDGNHEYEEVRHDFLFWAQNSYCALFGLHDSTGGWEGPTRVVQEALEDGWQLVKSVGYTSFLRRSIS